MKNIIITLFMVLSANMSATGKWTVSRIEKDYSPKNDITALSFDKHGNLWASTSCGVFSFADGKWSDKGLDNAYLHTLYIDHNDKVWAGLYLGGLHCSSDGVNWTKMTQDNMSGSVNAITSDKQGNLWVGDWNFGLFSLDASGKTWSSYRSEKKMLGDNAVFSLTVDAKNQLWAGTTHGVSRFADAKWEIFNTQNSKLPDNVVYSLTSDVKGTVWIGTAHGLVKVNGSEWQIFNQANSGLSCDLILSLATDPKGKVWIGTNKGVFCFDGVKWEHFTTENSPLPDNRIQAITIRDNKVYLGTSFGLAVYE